MDNQPQETDQAQLKESKLMAILSYIGPLVLVPYFISRADPFVRFHVRQGFVLLVIELAAWVLSALLFFIFPVIQLINVGAFILSLFGIVNAAQGLEKELPLVGQYAHRINI